MQCKLCGVAVPARFNIGLSMDRTSSLPYTETWGGGTEDTNALPNWHLNLFLLFLRSFSCQYHASTKQRAMYFFILARRLLSVCSYFSMLSLLSLKWNSTLICPKQITYVCFQDLEWKQTALILHSLMYAICVILWVMQQKSTAVIYHRERNFPVSDAGALEGIPDFCLLMRGTLEQ